MYSPSTRLLTILELLQARERVSGPELAARLEVSPRSVRRYITMLQEMGIPVEGERGRYGRYRLRPGYKLPPLMFSDDEAVALTVGLLLLRRSGGLVDAVTTEGAFAKLDRVLPEAVRRRVVALQDTLQVEPPRPASPYAEPVPVAEQLAVLSQGVKERRRVQLSYDRGGRITERALDPYAVVQRGPLWHVVGYCHLREEVRIFRVDRIVKLALGDETFRPPEPFDAADYIGHAFATIPALYTTEVLLKTDLETARREAFPAAVTFSPHPEGVLMRCTTDGFGWLARLLATFSFDWAVRSPPELEAALREHAETLIARLRGVPAQAEGGVKGPGR